ncbi:TPA: hypothetical protein N0F65_004766 [Lagenidium giganteum]|uniref:Carrier domain-containing protein n=1 Tax=Lagenidium giganteum TaxID=4803 RepID=A0AAV2YVB8_9STRA|nr:TPA: hypothetical protein N0F65_004766 [Lagenidium giganteum]
MTKTDCAGWDGGGGAVDVPMPLRALDDGKVDAVLHWLLVTLGNPMDGTQKQRFRTLKAAVERMDQLVHRQQIDLAPGVCVDPSDACLSYAQLQMFALHQLQPRSTAYNVLAPFASTQRHWSDARGQPRQVEHLLDHFLAQTHGRVVHVLEHDDRLQSLSDFIVAATNQPFDLEHDMPIRMYAITTLQHAPVEDSDAAWTFVVVMHHIVTDAESSRIFWRDWTLCYSQCLQPTHGPSDDLLPASTATELTYRDYATWQRDQLQSGVLSSSLQYWIDRFADDVPVLELPLDQSRPHVSEGNDESTTQHGDVVVFRSSGELQKRFTAFCVQHGASMFVGGLALFQLLLSRLSGVNDIVIGAPTSGRNHGAHADLDHLMGYFVNTLPFRIASPDAGATSFEQFLRIVRDVVLDAFAHMEIPFQKMLEYIHVDRTQLHPAQNPLFQVMFAWEGGDDGTSLNHQHLQTTDIKLPHHTSKFDLMLSLRYAQHGADQILEGSLEYNTAIFRRTTIERFGGYFIQLMENVMENPVLPLCQLSMLPPSEARMLVDKWGAPPSTVADISVEKASFLDDLVRLQAMKTPDQPALFFDGLVWTYDKLWTRSCSFAAALHRRGIQPGMRVGLFLDRGFENVAAILGVLQVRAVFIPLDPEFPLDRIKYMLEDSQAQFIISQQHLSQKLDRLARGDGINVILTESLPTNTQNHAQPWCDLLHDLVAAETIAYVLYTSGSTGKPKGVMVTHANILTTVRWTVREYNVTAKDVFLQSTTSTLDGSLTQLFSPLVAGGSAVITRKNGLHDLEYMRTLLTTHPITFCVFVPSYFAMLMDYCGQFPGYVKHIILAGETFPTALARKFYANNADKTSATCLVNEYGPTEASVTSTFYRYSRDQAARDIANVCTDQQQQSVPIGLPIDDHYVVVLDGNKQLVPVNVAGELYIGGLGVAKGYWDRPELTAKSFIEQQLASEVPVQRWYKTGDLVKWLPTGQLIFLGRTDSQVKLRGMRIELHEVRNVLVQHAIVKDAEVLVQQDRLVGYVILDCNAMTGREVDAIQILIDHLKTRLPPHMVPHEMHDLEQWPRTPNGKLDVRALGQMHARHSAQTASRSSNQDHRDQASDSTTTTIAEAIARDVLKQVWMETLDLQDDAVLESMSFFELGGNSLSAIRVISLVKPHGIALKLEHFFRCKNVFEMAQTAARSMDVVMSLTHAPSPLVPLNWRHRQNALDRPALFLVHCADGTVWKMLELARLLPFPVVGIQAIQHEGSDAADSIEALAERYWSEVKKTQPEGPYALGGFSFGCRVAHEMARLALAEGQRLQPLVLIDGLPFALTNQCDTTSEVNARSYVESAFGWSPILRSSPQPQEGDTSSAIKQQHDNDEAQMELMEQISAQFKLHCKMDAKYQPVTMVRGISKDFEMQVSLFKTQHWDVDSAAFEQLGVAISVQVIPSASHLAILQKPSVEALAQAIILHTS